MNIEQRLSLLFTLWISISLSCLTAQLQIPDIFSDHMVLQRDLAIPIWGTANVEGRVELMMNQETVETVADSKGNWKVTFAPMMAGGPYTLTIKSNNAQIKVVDIYIGEVWICAGQSNMEWPLNKASTENEEIPKAGYPMIRLFHYKKKHDTFKSPYSLAEIEAFSKGDFFHQAVWTLCTSETAAVFSAVGYFYGKELHHALNVPIGLIQVAVGGSPCQSWVSKEALVSHPQLQHLQDGKQPWIDSNIIHPWLAERANQNWENWEKTPNTPLPGHPFAPSYLYESAIESIAPYAMRGAIWYQGESNATHPSSYPAMKELLLKSWRTIWRQGDFPFYFVQLPRIGNRNLWAEFREAQQQCLSNPNTGMVVTIDQGHLTDVHPIEKIIIGNRLADLALTETYHHDIPAKSPMLSSHNWEVTERKITLHVDHTFEGLETNKGEKPKGLYLQGYLNQGSMESIIVPENIMLSKDQIIITYPVGFLPVKVKYAWASYPENNITNSAGLPLAPFKINLQGLN